MVLNVLEQFVFKTSTLNSGLIVLLGYVFTMLVLMYEINGGSLGAKFYFVFTLIRAFYRSVFCTFISFRFNRYAWILLFFFFIIFGLNMLGTFMYSFAFTASCYLTSLFTCCLVLWTYILAVFRFNSNILSLLAPLGTPGFLAKTLVLIEFVSFFSRLISLNVRLFINIVSGHLVLKLLLNFFAYLMIAWGPFAWLAIYSTVFYVPVAGLLTLAVFALEVFISALQAYIYFFLLCIYLENAMW